MSDKANFTEAILDEGRKDLSYFRNQMIAAADFEFVSTNFVVADLFMNLKLILLCLLKKG